MRNFHALYFDLFSLENSSKAFLFLSSIILLLLLLAGKFHPKVE